MPIISRDFPPLSGVEGKRGGDIAPIPLSGVGGTEDSPTDFVVALGDSGVSITSFLIIIPPLSPKAETTVFVDVEEAKPGFEDVEEGELLRDFEGLKEMASSFVRKMEAARIF